MKINKVTMIEIGLLAVVFIAVAIYYSPHFQNNKKETLSSKIKTNNETFTSKALDEFNKDKTLKPSVVAKKVSDELNKTIKNPYNKKKEAFTFETGCTGCSSVEYDDNLTMIILTTYDKKGELVARTVIKPPSFVVYEKDKQ